MPIISDQQIDSYQRDGAIVLRQIFDKHWLGILAEGMAQGRLEPSHRSTMYVDNPDKVGQFFYDARTIGDVDGYDRLMLDSPMGEIAGRMMQSHKAIAFYISVFERSCGTKDKTPWHQDQPSWSAGGNQACSIWMSLDPVPQETALEFVRGSHLWSTEYHRPTFFHAEYDDDDHSQRPSFPDIENHRDDYDIISWALEPGDCLVFHGMTAHGGSGGLPPGLGRRTVSVQWLGDDARHRTVPGGDDPNISAELAKHGVKPGDPVVCDICPIVWQDGFGPVTS